ncbi:MAG: hypothetical protein MN733_22435, partial [Nitrososphaera sp.]|nr:hypothetical protein [Nitrososphaera sp.]
NFAATGAVSIWAVPERFFAAGMDIARVASRRIVGKEAKREVYFGESAAMLFAAVTSLGDAVRAGTRAFRTGKSEIGPSIMEDLAAAVRRESQAAAQAARVVLDSAGARARVRAPRIPRMLGEVVTPSKVPGLPKPGLPPSKAPAVSEEAKAAIEQIRRNEELLRQRGIAIPDPIDISRMEGRPRFRVGPGGIRRVLPEVPIPPAMRQGPRPTKQAQHLEAEDTTIGQGLGFWGTLWRSPTRGLGFGDEFFKRINFNMETYAQAYRDAVKAGDLSVARMQQFVNNPPASALARSREFAVINTLQRAIDEIGPGFAIVGKTGRHISDFSLGDGAIPLGRLVVPVLRTPLNLGHFTLERTPLLGFLSKTLRDDIKAGGRRASMALGKQAASATLIASLMPLVNAGMITGTGPADERLRRQKHQLTGWQPCSVNIGGVWHGLDRLEPIGSMICLAADIAEVSGHVDDATLEQLFQGLKLAASEHIIDNRFLENTSNFFEMLAGDEEARKRVTEGGVRIGA